MAAYVRTGPFVNLSAPGLSSTFFNNIESVFLRQSGDTETGKYLFEGGSWAIGATSGYWIGFVSRSSPVSIAVDTSITLTSYAAPTTTQLVQSGFNVNAAATAVSNTGRFGGAWTATY